MTANTLTTLDKVLTDVYEPSIVNTLLQDTTMFQYTTMEEEAFDATRKRYITYKYGRNEGIGARDEGDALPTPGTPSYEQHYIVPKYVYGSIEFTGQAYNMVMKGGAALVNAVDEHVADFTDSMVNEMNRIFWGYGSGRLAQVNGAVSSSTSVTVDSEGGTRLLAKGMRVDVYNSGSTSPDIDSDVIASVDSVTGITLTTGGSCDDDAWIFREDAYGKEPMGILGIVDDGTLVATFQGGTRANVDQLNAYVLSNSGTGRDLTESLLMSALSIAYERANGKISDIIMHPKTLREYQEDLITADRMFMVNPSETPQYTGGYRLENASFGGVPIKLDRDAPLSRVLLIERGTFKWFSALPGLIGWLNDDGHIFRQVEGYDKIRGHMRVYGNMGSRNPMPNVRIDDISYTANDFLEWR